MINQIFPKIISKVDYFEKETIVSYVNAYNYLKLRKNSKTVQSIDRFTLDGIYLLILIRFLFFKKFKRLSPDFSSYFKDLFLLAEKNKKSFFFLGANAKEIEDFVNIIKKRYPQLGISGFHNGFFNTKEMEPLSKTILVLNPDVVFIGLGSPKQEAFSIFLKNNGFKGTIYTCGAFISQTASHGVNYYPKLINTFHLRWVYRLIQEKGLFKRYFLDYPFATITIILDFIKRKA